MGVPYDLAWFARCIYPEILPRGYRAALHPYGCSLHVFASRPIPQPTNLTDDQFIARCKINALYMIMRAGRGHIGSSFSALHIFVPILRHQLRPQDHLFSSKGHDCAGLYAVLMATGRLSWEYIDYFRQPGHALSLPGHPDPTVPRFKFVSGSLGMGLSKALGLATVQPDAKVHVVLGDGELDEGQIWEAVYSYTREHPAPNNMRVHIDANGWSSSTITHPANAQRIRQKSGWGGRYVSRKIENLVHIYKSHKAIGVSRWANNPAKYHSGAPEYTDYQQAIIELITQAGGSPKIVEFTPTTPTTTQISPIPVYGAALLELMAANDKVVVLVADLAKRCGLSEVYT